MKLLIIFEFIGTIFESVVNDVQSRANGKEFIGYWMIKLASNLLLIVEDLWGVHMTGSIPFGTKLGK